MLRWNIIVHLLTMIVSNPYQTFYVFPTPHPPPMCQPYPSEPVVKTAWGRCIDRGWFVNTNPPNPAGLGTQTFGHKKGRNFHSSICPHTKWGLYKYSNSLSPPGWVWCVRKFALTIWLPWALFGNLLKSLFSLEELFRVEKLFSFSGKLRDFHKELSEHVRKSTSTYVHVLCFCYTNHIMWYTYNIMHID